MCYKGKMPDSSGMYHRFMETFRSKFAETRNYLCSFLKPIEYIEFCNMRAAEVGELVKERIADKLIEILGEC